MKNIKKLFLPLFVVSPLSIFLSVSCSNQYNNDSQINNLKNILDNLITTNKSSKDNIFVNNSVSIINESVSKKESLFKILLNDSNLINTYFSIDQNNLKTQFLANNSNDYDVYFSFFYDVIDSYGNKAKPFLSLSKNSITIPILLNFKDLKNNIEISKFVNFITLDIQDSIVNDDEDNGYNGVNGKSIVFQSNHLNDKKIIFKSVPKEMIDRYLNFILTINDENYKLPPIYQSKSEDLSEWKGKTLSEVRNISKAISAPLKQVFNSQSFIYTIKNSYFDSNERQYANFVMEISLDSSQMSSKVFEDAKNIYGLEFSHEYSIIVKKWAFAFPNSSDISAYVSNNKTMLDPLVEQANENIFIYIPTITINPNVAREIGVSGIVKNSNDWFTYVKEPKSFLYLAKNGQEREISFDIVSLEEVSEDKDILKININMNIDKGDLRQSSMFSKQFNIKKWQFQ